MYEKSKTAERIRDARKSMSWTRDELSAQIRAEVGEIVSADSIYSYENGKNGVPPAVLVALAKVFRVTTDYLLGVSDDPNPYAAEVTRYTGLSERAAKALNNMLIADGSNRASLAMLNDMILHPGFDWTLTSMYLLRHRAEEIKNVDIRIPESDGEELMNSRIDGRTYKTVNDRYGVAVILKNIDAVHYEADRVVWEFRDMIASICGVRKAERIWAKKCADKHAEYNRKFAEEEK